MPSKADIIKTAKTRRSGLVTADRYFRSVEQCFDGGVCPISAFGLKSQDEWERNLKESAEQLVYANEEMLVTEKSRDNLGEFTKAKGSVVMQLDAVITSTKRDRDRDVLETKGASVDLKSPLLWQHIPMQPIGSLVSLTGHTDDKLAGRFVIADTELGRDAATLVEAGALRISHGFEPTKFKPLKDEGWHIEEFEIFEVSLVSVPSNTDAVITQFSREKLHNPMVRQWAEKMYQERPTQVAVSANVIDLTSDVNSASGTWTMSGTTDSTSGETEYWNYVNPEPCGCDKVYSFVPCGCEKSADDTDKMDMEDGEMCCCPKCGYEGKMDEFKMGDEKSAPAIESHKWSAGGEYETLPADELVWKDGEPRLEDAVRYVLESTDMGGIKHLEGIIRGKLDGHEQETKAKEIEAENTALLEALSD